MSTAFFIKIKLFSDARSAAEPGVSMQKLPPVQSKPKPEEAAPGLKLTFIPHRNYPYSLITRRFI